MLVDAGLDLVVRQVVDLADLGALGNRLAEDYVEGAELSVDGGLDVEVLDPLAHELDAAAHTLQTLLQIADLDRAVDGVLLLTGDDQLQALDRQLVVLLGLEIFLMGNQTVLVKTPVLLVFALLALGVDGVLQPLLLEVELFLLHGHCGVPQEVLLLGQVGLALENLQSEGVVGQADEHVAFFDH